jgi:hypothetical protein
MHKRIFEPVHQSKSSAFKNRIDDSDRPSVGATRRSFEMKLVLVYASVAVLGLACMTLVYAQAAASSTAVSDKGSTPVDAPVDPALIAKLQQLENQDLRSAGNGNKASMVYSRKAAEIRELIDRLQRGEPVNPSEIDTALEPIGTW